MPAGFSNHNSIIFLIGNSLFCCFEVKVQKPEALTTSGRSEVQKHNLHNNRYIQPAGGSQLTPAESDQAHRLMQSKQRGCNSESDGQFILPSSGQVK
jgi:hypothetical protein